MSLYRVAFLHKIPRVTKHGFHFELKNLNTGTLFSLPKKPTTLKVMMGLCHQRHTPIQTNSKYPLPECGLTMFNIVLRLFGQRQVERYCRIVWDGSGWQVEMIIGASVRQTNAVTPSRVTPISTGIGHFVLIIMYK